MMKTMAKLKADASSIARSRELNNKTKRKRTARENMIAKIKELYVFELQKNIQICNALCVLWRAPLTRAD